MDLGLQQKTALVFGAGGGLGGAIAKALAAEGAAVIVADINLDAAKATAAAIASAGGRSRPIGWDLADPAVIEANIAGIEAEFGGVDVLVNNTGGPPPTPAAGQDPALWLSSFQSMVLSVIAITDRVLPTMRARKWGRVITSTSSGVVAPIPNLGISNALRLSLVGWSKTLAREVGRDGVTCNIVLPGRIATSRITFLDERKAEREGRSVADIAAGEHRLHPSRPLRRSTGIWRRCRVPRQRARVLRHRFGHPHRWRPDPEHLRKPMALEQSVVDTLKAVSTATITTVLLKKGLRNVWLRGTKPLAPGQPRLVGPAFTLRFVPAREDLATPASWASPISTRAAIEAMPAGCIAVVDAMGVTDAGIFGDILCARMLKRGVVALITDGVVRDVAGVLGTGLPVWCNGVAAPPSVAGLTFVAWQQPIACGGVAVFPDDVIVVDDDGAVLIPAALLPEVLAEAPEQERTEAWIMNEIGRDVPLPGLYPMNADTKARYEAAKKDGSA